MVCGLLFSLETHITVKSFIFMGLKFRGLEIKNEYVDIYFRCFLMCSQTENCLFKQVFVIIELKSRNTIYYMNTAC